MKSITGKSEHSDNLSAAHNACSSAVCRSGGSSRQMKLRSYIEKSPLMAAQRKRLEGIFGTSQLKENLSATSQFSDEEDESLMMKTAQRQEEDESLMMKTAQRQEEDESLMMKTAQMTKNRTGMPDNVKTSMENSFNADFSDVKVHANSSKAPEVGALAYTQGSDIHFAPGQFSPAGSHGRSLLGHELAHVVQQSEGRVRPTTSVAGMPVNDNPGLEREADILGSKAANS